MFDVRLVRPMAFLLCLLVFIKTKSYALLIIRLIFSKNIDELEFCGKNFDWFCKYECYIELQIYWRFDLGSSLAKKHTLFIV